MRTRAYYAPALATSRAALALVRIAESFGDYYCLVSGTGTGLQGGLYTVSSSATPVPETYTLILGGLAAVGLMVRRRLRKREQAIELQMR